MNELDKIIKKIRKEVERKDTDNIDTILKDVIRRELERIFRAVYSLSEKGEI